MDRVRALGRRHVRGKPARPAPRDLAEARDGRVDGLLRAAVHDHVGAFLEQRGRDRVADAGRAARDERLFAFELQVEAELANDQDNASQPTANDFFTTISVRAKGAASINAAGYSVPGLASMAAVNSTLRLFDAFGIEVEYMLVDGESLDVAPAADRLLEAAAGELTENGRTATSRGTTSLRCT